MLKCVDGGEHCVRKDRSRFRRVRIRHFLPSILVILFTLLPPGMRPALAQSSISLSPTSPPPSKGESLEVEVIEIHRGGAVPAEIHRKKGRFLLLVINRNSVNPDAAFVLDPGAIGDGKLGPAPLLQVGGARVNDSRHRSASLFAAPAGEFDLKYADSGKAVCKIVIE